MPFQRTSNIPLNDAEISTERSKHHNTGHYSPPRKNEENNRKNQSGVGRNTHSHTAHYQKETSKHNTIDDTEDFDTQTKVKMKYTKIEAEVDSKHTSIIPSEKSSSSYAHLRSKSHSIF